MEEKQKKLKTPFRFYDKHPYLGVFLEIVVAVIFNTGTGEKYQSRY